MTARQAFVTELEQLHTDLIKMGALVEQSIDNAVLAFKTQDKTIAKETIANDRLVNDMEKNIEARCLSLILRQQPVATDLRNISSALKIVTDMERIGDQSADICDLIMRIEVKHAYNTIDHIPNMAKIAKSMVHDAIYAFINQDLDLASNVAKRDDEVDALFDAIKKDLSSLIQPNSEILDDLIDLLMIAKYLERIGDHAVNICEWAEFSRTGLLNDTKLI